MKIYINSQHNSHSKFLNNANKPFWVFFLLFDANTNEWLLSSLFIIFGASKL